MVPVRLDPADGRSTSRTVPEVVIAVHEPGLTGADEKSLLVEMHVVPPIAVMVLGGDLDLHTVDQLDAVLRALDAVAVDQLTIDLREVDFVSVGALSAIALAGVELESRNGRLTIHGGRPIHRRVLDLVGGTGIAVTE